MDKTFNFFKSKIKKEGEKNRHYSKSNSSKASGSKYSYKPKQQPLKYAPLSAKEKEIRNAIEARFQRSKLRTYRYEHLNSASRRKNSHSSEREEYRHLKKMKVVDLKDYHRRNQSLRHSENSSRERPVINLKLKLGNVAMRTEGDEDRKPLGRSVKALSKNTPSSLSKQKEEWRFISIQVREDLSKPKGRKAEVKINSHRSCTVQEPGHKLKNTSSLNKGLDRAKPKDPARLTRTRF